VVVLGVWQPIQTDAAELHLLGGQLGLATPTRAVVVQVKQRQVRARQLPLVVLTTGHRGATRTLAEHKRSWIGDAISVDTVCEVEGHGAVWNLVFPADVLGDALGAAGVGLVDPAQLMSFIITGLISVDTWLRLVDAVLITERVNVTCFIAVLSVSFSSGDAGGGGHDCGGHGGGCVAVGDGPAAVAVLHGAVTVFTFPLLRVVDRKWNCSIITFALFLFHTFAQGVSLVSILLVTGT